MQRCRRSVVASLLAALVLSSAGCAGERVATQPSTPAPVGSETSPLPTPTGSAQEKETELDGGRRVGWRILDLYRHGRFVTLDFALVNRTREALDVQSALSRNGEDDDVSGVSIRDAGNRYFPARYGKTCYCTYDAPSAANGQTLYLTATYLVPSSRAKAFDVSMPTAGTFGRVPVGTAPDERPMIEAPPGLPDPAGNLVAQPAGIEPDGPVTRAYLVLSVYGVYRQGRQATVLMGLALRGEVPHGAATTDERLLSAPGDPSGVTGVVLVDGAEARAYGVTSDAEGSCVCSETPVAAAYATTVVSATVAAPPASADRVDVVVPQFGVVTGVPVERGSPPEPDAASPLPHSTRASVTRADDVSTAEPTRFPETAVTAGR